MPETDNTEKETKDPKENQEQPASSEDDDIGFFKSMDKKWAFPILLSLVVIAIGFCVLVVPVMKRHYAGATSVIEQSNEEGYWHERFGY